MRNFFLAPVPIKVAGLFLLTCACTDRIDRGGFGVQRSALSAPTNAQAILSFETPGNWTAVQGTGTLGSSTTASDGSLSLSFATSGWIEIQSARLSSSDVTPTPELGVDLLLPLAQPSPSWFGQVFLYVDCPSRGIKHQLADQKDLNSLRRGIFDTVQLAVPRSIVDALNGGAFNDLAIDIGFSVSSPDSYLVDNVRFSPRSVGSEPQQALAITSDILGFETEGDWTVTQGQHEQSNLSSQGAASISVHDFTWTELRSARVSSLGAVGSSIRVDVRLPGNCGGSRADDGADLYLDSPSLGLQGVHVGRQTFAALPLGQFGTLSFDLTPDLVAQLSGEYSDLVFRIDLSVPLGGCSLLLDNLRTVDLIPKLEGIVQLTTSSFVAVFSYTSSSPGLVTVPVGVNNRFLPDPLGRGQPTVFQPAGGTFAVAFDGTPLTWQLLGHVTDAASSGSPQLPTVPMPDGTGARLPDGRLVPIQTDLAKVLSTTIVGTDNQGGVTPGRTDARFQVTGDGAATYDIPLWVPEGRAGIAPSLALRYHSRSGDGQVGMGWTLAGLSQIARCHTTLATDANVQPIKFNSTDALCLDGQRLVFATNAGTSEYRTLNDTFKRIVPHGTDPEGPDYFEVFLKDGRILQYGVTPGSRVEGPRVRVTANRSDTSAPVVDYPRTVRFGWSLSGVRDRFGNSMSMEYALDSETEANGNGVEQRLTAIRYTAGAGGSPALREVSLHYEARPDPTDRYINGLKLMRRQRLIDISMSGPNPRAQALLREYTLTYLNNSSTRRSLLGSVKECAADGVCKAPTTFSWSGGGSRSYGATIIYPGPTAEVNPSDPSLSSLTVGDFDGDGRDDVSLLTVLAGRIRNTGNIRFSRSSGLSTTTFADSETPVVALPMNPNGLSPLLGARTETHPFDGLGLQTRQFWRYGQLVDDGKGGFLYGFLDDLDRDGMLSGDIELEDWNDGTAGLMRPIFAADLHGDGIADIVRPLSFSNIPTVHWGVRAGRKSPDFFTQYFSLAVELPPDSSVVSFMADLDGDGQSEFLTGDTLAPAPSARYAGLNLKRNGDLGYQLTSLPLAHDKSGGNLYQIGDINGDGLADAFSIPFDGGFPSIYVNTGNGFLPPVTLVASSPGIDGRVASRAKDELNPFDVPNDQGVRLGDWDGDGRTDIFLLGDRNHKRPSATGSDVWVYRTAGVGPPTLVDTGVPVGSRVTYDHACSGLITCEPVDLTVGYARSQLADLTGNGLADIISAVNPNDGSLQVALQVGTKPDMLTGIIDGLNAEIQVSYKPISDPTVYTKGADAANVFYPNSLSTRGIWVVDSESTDIGDDFAPGKRRGLRTVTHTYEGAQTDVVTREWLGFSSHVEKDPSNNRTTTREYFTDRDRRFLLKSDVTVVVAVGPSPGPVPLHEYIHEYFWDRIPNPQSRGYIGLLSEFEQTNRIDPGHPVTDKRTIRQRSKTYTRDEFDNPTVVEAIDSMGPVPTRTVTNNTFVNDTANWLIGFKKREESTSTGPGFDSAVRVRAFDPEPNTVLTRTTTIEPDGAADVFLATTIARDPQTGQVRSTTLMDKNGVTRSASIDYDDVDGVYPSRVTNGAGHVTLVAMHPGLGVMGRLVDPNGIADAWQYDGFGRMKVYRPGGGEQSNVSYLPADNPVLGGMKTTTAFTGGGQETLVLDRLNRPRARKVLGPSGQTLTSTQSYNARGLLFQTSSNFPTASDKDTYGYDDVGRLGAVFHADGSSMGRDYDDTSIVESDEMGVVRRIDLDTLDRPAQVVEIQPGRADATTKYTYGAFGVMTQITDPKSNVTTMEYDARGRLRVLTDKDRGRRETVLNGFGEPVTSIDPLGLVQRFYDVLGRLDHEQDAGRVRGFTWDTASQGIGMLAQATSVDATVQLGYDEFGRQSSTQWSVGGASPFSFKYKYDQFGRPSELFYPVVAGHDRFAIKQVYGSTGHRLAIVDDRQGHTADFWRLIGADAATGQITQKLAGGITRVSQFENQRGFIQSEKTTTSTGAVLESFGYTFNPNGTLKQKTSGVDGSVEDFTYDSMNRVATWSTNGHGNYAYGYDDLGNLLSRTAQGSGAALPNLVNHYDQTNGAGPHAVSSSTLGSYTYDRKGNQVDGPGRHVTYSSFDLPTEVRSGATTERFGYSAFGSRVVKNDGTTTVVTLGGLYEMTTSPAGTEHVFFVPLANNTVAQMTIKRNGMEEVLAILKDNLGSPSTLVRSDGTAAERFKYDPFGTRIDPATFGARPAGSTLTTDTFAGHKADPEIALIDMNGRMYDPGTGRFATPDPIIAGVSSQFLNPYTYVSNQPTTLVDPLGLDPELVDIHTVDGTLNQLGTTTVDRTWTDVSFDPSLVPYAPITPDWASPDTLGGVPILPTTPGVPARQPLSQNGNSYPLPNGDSVSGDRVVATLPPHVRFSAFDFPLSPLPIGPVATVAERVGQSLLSRAVAWFGARLLARLPAAQIAEKLIARAAGSSRAALPLLNKLGLSQLKAAQVVEKFFELTGRGSGGTQMIDKTLIVLPRTPGFAAPIIGVTEAGEASFGSATVELTGDLAAPLRAVPGTVSLP